MSYTLEQFAAKCHDALKGQPGTEGRKAVCALVKDVLRDGEFAKDADVVGMRCAYADDDEAGQ